MYLYFILQYTLYIAVLIVAGVLARLDFFRRNSPGARTCSSTCMPSMLPRASCACMSAVGCSTQLRVQHAQQQALSRMHCVETQRNTEFIVKDTFK
jgi:hypothetical protein